MSPEQARGEEATEASDVFSFGLLLQELLTGRPAFEGTTGSAVLVKIVSGEREALPVGTDPEVATLVAELTALDPMLRPSAQEALERLRWIRDRPARRRRRRVRIAVLAVLAAALTAALVAGVQAWRTSRQAELQAVAARQLGEEVQAVETLLRLGHLAPPHDVSRERRQAEERLRNLEARTADLGPWARGPLAYARGRIELALGRPFEARAALEEAWALGYERPEVAEALGLTLGALYYEAVDDAHRLGSVALRKEALERAAAEIREPAANWLRRGVGANSRPLAEARIALYEEQFDDAEALAQQAAEEVPWLYEAFEVRARALLERGRKALAEGRTEAAVSGLDAADSALVAGQQVARSHPGLRSERCRLGGERVLRLGPKADPSSIVDAVMPSCEEAQALRPDSVRPLLARADLEHRAAFLMVESRRDPEPWVSDLEATARSALELDPNLSKGHYLLGKAADLRGQRAAGIGEPYVAHLRRAVEFFQEALLLDSDSRDAFYGLGQGLFSLGYWAVINGEDPVEDLEAAVRAFSEAHRLAPTAFAPVSMRGSAHGVLGMAALERGRDPVPHLEDSIAAFDAAIELSPADPVAYGNRAMAYRDLAIFHWLQGEPLTEEVLRGKADLAKSGELNSGAFFNEYFTRVELELLAARSAVDLGEAPEGLIDQAFESIAELRALELADASGETYEIQAYLVKADARLAKDLDPDSALFEAKRIADRLTDSPQPEELRAAILLRRARWAESRGQDAGGASRVALEHVHNALEQRPEDGDLWLLRGQLEAFTDPAMAEQSLLRALEINPWLGRQVEEVRKTFPPTPGLVPE